MNEILRIYKNLSCRLNRSAKGVIYYKGIKVTDDILQDAVIRFRSFNPDRCANPEAFLYLCLKWASGDRTRKEVNDKVHSISGDTPAHKNEYGESSTLLDSIPYQDSLSCINELFDLIETVVFPDRDLDLVLIASLLLEGYTQRNIARLIGIPEYTLTRRLNYARNQLAAVMKSLL